MRSHIVQVAMAMFSEHGFSATSTRKIARAAGVSEGLIFHHFGTKLGLLTSAAERSQTLGEQIMVSLAEQPEAEVETQLRLIARSFTNFLRADRIEARVFRVLLAESSTNPELHALHRERTRVVLKGLGHYLQAKVEAGELRSDLAVDSAAQLLLGSFLWFFLSHGHLSLEAWTEAAEHHADAVVDHWLRGARPEGKSA